MIYRILVGLSLVFAGLWSCTPEDEILLSEATNLQFSTDTIFFDTLFTNELSVTKRLKIYNPEKKAILIDKLQMQGGGNSPYTLKVNGQTGKFFGPLQILGGDSLLVLLEATLPANSAKAPYLYPDAVVTENKGLAQQVPVIGYGQNANVLPSGAIACNTNWTAELPYIIEDSVIVLANCQLIIERGARIYFKPGAALYIQGTLIAEGDSALNDQIIFRNFRLDAAYDQPAQWRGLNFLVGTKDNRLRYCQVRNAIIGIQLGSPDNDELPEITLDNCQIVNHYTAGILAFGSDLQATNTLVANCIGPAIAGLAGGNYAFAHCTFANFYRGSVSRDLPTAFFADIYQVQGPNNGEVLTFADALNINMQNCIVWGNLFDKDEWVFDFSAGQPVSLNIQNNLIRTESELLVPGNITSLDRSYPQFNAVEDLDFTPTENSPAKDAGLLLNIEKDLIGNFRDGQPDIGALEYVEAVEGQ